MKYYAKVFTGTPATGMIAPGDMLTDKQVSQLGEEKILELCGRGILGQMPGTEAEAQREEPGAKEKKSENAGAGPEDPADQDDPEAEPKGEDAPEDEDSEETEEELPELDDGEDLVSDDEPEPEAEPEPKPEKPARKTARSGKKEK